MARGTSLGSATIDLELEYAKVSKGIDQVNRKLGGFEKGLKKVSSSMKAAFSVGAIVGFAATVSKTLDSLDNIGKTADKIGLSTSALQEMRFAAEQAGISSRQLDMGLQRFVRRTAEAAKGTGELKQIYADLGIELKNADGSLRGIEEVMYDYADAIANTEDSQEQLRLAFKAFDSEGAALVNLFREGSIGIEELRSELRGLGGVIDENLIRESEAANDAMNRLSKAISGTTTSLIAELAPAIEAAADWIVKLPAYLDDLQLAFTDLIDDVMGLADSFIQFKDDTIKAVKETVQGVRQWFGNPLESAADAAVGAFDAVSQAGYDLWDDMVGNSYIPDMVTAIRDWFGRLDTYMVVPAKQATDEVSGFFSDLESSVGNALKSVINGTKSLKDAIKDLGKELLTGAIDKGIDQLMGKLFSGTGGGGLKSIGGKVASAIGKIFGGGGAGGGSTLFSGGLGKLFGGGGGGLGKMFSGFKNLFSGNGIGSLGGLAAIGSIAAYGFGKLAKNKQRKQEAQQRFAGIDAVTQQLNPVSAFRGIDEATGKFFITLNEGWSSTLEALTEANVLIKAQGALYDENGNELVEMTGNLEGVKAALSGATATGFEFKGSLEGAIEKGNDLRVAIQGDADQIKMALEAATGMGIGGFKNLQTTATGVSATLTGDIQRWNDFLQSFVNNAIQSAISGVNSLEDGARGATEAFLELARAASKAGSSRSRGSAGLKRFATGGISNEPAIFGEAGPEAAVPLPDGRTIPVTIKGGMSDGETNELLRRLIKVVERSNMQGLALA